MHGDQAVEIRPGRVPAGTSPALIGIQCIGQPLARLELQIALATLLRRLPGLRLGDTPPEQLEYRHSMTVFGVYNLPVAW